MKAAGKIEIGILIVILVLSIFLRYIDPIFLSALPIIPDSVEYTVLAYNLFHGEGFHITINDESYPPRYPYGYPLLLLPIIAVFGSVLHNAVFASLFFGIVLIFLTYLLARALFGPGAGLIAAFFVAVSPLCITFSRIILAINASAALALLTVFLSIRLLRRDDAAAHSCFLWLGIGILMGFNASVQLITSLSIIPVALGILVMRKRSWSSSLGALALGFFLAIVPLLLYFKLAYGSFFVNGYKYWVPEIYGSFSDSFSISFIFANTKYPEDGQGMGNLLYYTRYLLGRGSNTGGNPYPLAFIPFVVLGIVRVILDVREKRRGQAAFLILFIGTFVSFGIFMLFYCFQLAKLLLFIVPMIIIVGAYGMRTAFSLVASRALVRRVVGIVILIFLVPMAWYIGGFLVMGGLRQQQPPWVLQPFESVMAVDRVAEDDAAIISSVDGVYVTHYAVAGKKRTYIPMTRGAEYISKRDLPLIVADENHDAIENFLATGRSVYVDGFTARGWREQMMKLGRRFDIKRVATYHNGQLHIYKLELRHNK